MRLLRLQDVEIGLNDRVFRHARLQALIVWLAGFAATTALFFHAYTGKWPPGYIGSFLLLFVLLTLRMVTARFHPSNWLVRMNETGIYVQYRSYLNYQLPTDDPSVVFVSLGEIASARLVKERIATPDPAKPAARKPNTCAMSNLSYPARPRLSQRRCRLSAPNRPHWKNAGMAPVRLFIGIIHSR